jgi:hypothetical protein
MRGVTGAGSVSRSVSRLRMSITGYKRLAFALAFVCVGLVLTLAYGFREYSRVRAIASESGFLRGNFRHAHDIITIYEMDRDLARKSGVTNAVERLYKLQVPSRPFENPAAQFVERERQRAVRDVIAYLRLKTGQNLGDEPEPWILAYGDDNLKMNQGAREEMSEVIDELRKGNYGKMIEQLRTNK